MVVVQLKCVWGAEKGESSSWKNGSNGSGD